MQKKRFITRAEFAREVGVSHQRIYALVKNGTLKLNKDDLLDAEKSKKIIEDRRQITKNKNKPYDESYTKLKAEHEKLKIENALFELRKKHKLSQPDLGKQIGTSGAIIGRYERGEMTPSIEVARKLADIFEVTLDFFGDGQKPS